MVTPVIETLPGAGARLRRQPSFTSSASSRVSRKERSVRFREPLHHHPHAHRHLSPADLSEETAER